MGLNNGAADGKAYAEAFRLGTVKRLEYLLRLSQSAAMVLDFDDYIVVCALRADDEPLRRSFGTFHRFHAVSNEIDEHLLNLDSVDGDRRQSSCQL